MLLNVAIQFSENPFGRFPGDGPNSGQRFREEFLLPKLREGSRVTVDLTGAHGLAPSFLEESFGGLVRAGLTVEFLRTHLTLKSDLDPSFVSEVWEYIEHATPKETKH
ncbi:MAG: STAS-like domain-containing protein [Proteobacteria bacterium]|nr:STAS-like domain-containing protein [Pseudomonadota bacterium]